MENKTPLRKTREAFAAIESAKDVWHERITFEDVQELALYAEFLEASVRGKLAVEALIADIINEKENQNETH